MVSNHRRPHQQTGLVHTCETVRHPDIFAIILTEKNTDHSFSRPLCSSPVVVCNGEEDEGRNRDGARHEGQRLRRGGRHGGEERTNKREDLERNSKRRILKRRVNEEVLIQHLRQAGNGGLAGSSGGF